ncbi:MAG: hypothetical protein N4A41_11180 [Crocinitomicaceae bacterium]|nr:hypothetical protein [Crocinitomicaceae bacterium]
MRKHCLHAPEFFLLKILGLVLLNHKTNERGMDNSEELKLFYKYYNWEAFPENDCRVSKPIDDTRFNRNNGQEVVFMVEEIMNSSGMTDRSAKIKLERMIRNELPEKVVHQDRVKIWILLNWFNSRF